MLSEDTPDIRESFLAGLKWVEDTSRQKHGKSFAGLGEAQQLEVMRSMASPQTPKHAFFLDLRSRTTFAYTHRKSEFMKNWVTKDIRCSDNGRAALIRTIMGMQPESLCVLAMQIEKKQESRA